MAADIVATGGWGCALHGTQVMLSSTAKHSGLGMSSGVFHSPSCHFGWLTKFSPDFSRPACLADFFYALEVIQPLPPLILYITNTRGIITSQRVIVPPERSCYSQRLQKPQGAPNEKPDRVCAEPSCEPAETGSKARGVARLAASNRMVGLFADQRGKQGGSLVDIDPRCATADLLWQFRPERPPCGAAPAILKSTLRGGSASRVDFAGRFYSLGGINEKNPAGVSPPNRAHASLETIRRKSPVNGLAISFVSSRRILAPLAFCDFLWVPPLRRCRASSQQAAGPEDAMI